MTLTANWSYPTTIRFGAGRIAEIGGACMAAGISRPLLVTDRGLASMEITARTLDILATEGFGRGIFHEVDPNPTGLNLAEGLRTYRGGGYDGVIAFGGGSALDLGKCIAFMAGQTRPGRGFEVDPCRPGGHPPDHRRADHGRHRFRGRARRRPDQHRDR